MLAAAIGAGGGTAAAACSSLDGAAQAAFLVIVGNRTRICHSAITCGSAPPGAPLSAVVQEDGVREEQHSRRKRSGATEGVRAEGEGKVTFRHRSSLCVGHARCCCVACL